MSLHRSTRVILNEGTVVGAEEKLPNGNYYYTYKGIPYGEPPKGKLRFQVYTYNLATNPFEYFDNSFSGSDSFIEIF